MCLACTEGFISGLSLQPEGRQFYSLGLQYVESGRQKAVEPPQGAREQFDDDEHDLRRCVQLI